MGNRFCNVLLPLKRRRADKAREIVTGVKAGETAVVIGRSGGEEITAYEVAEEAGTITNEVLSRLGKRLSAGWEKEDIDEIKK